eukprot:1141841-Pelagomonas_calceolata.AAC.1
MHTLFPCLPVSKIVTTCLDNVSFDKVHGRSHKSDKSTQSAKIVSYKYQRNSCNRTIWQPLWTFVDRKLQATNHAVLRSTDTSPSDIAAD